VFGFAAAADAGAARACDFFASSGAYRVFVFVAVCPVPRVHPVAVKCIKCTGFCSQVFSIFVPPLSRGIFVFLAVFCTRSAGYPFVTAFSAAHFPALLAQEFLAVLAWKFADKLNSVALLSDVNKARPVIPFPILFALV